jgi:hypothetical protein
MPEAFDRGCVGPNGKNNGEATVSGMIPELFRVLEGGPNRLGCTADRGRMGDSTAFMPSVGRSRCGISQANI